MPLFIAFFALLSITLIFFLILSKVEKEKIEFFHVMAHRFRSPISIAKWYVQLLSNTSVGKLNDKQKEYLSEISKASETLNETIESLMVLLQIQSNSLIIKIEEVNVKNLISKIVEKLQFKIERHKLYLQEVYPKDEQIMVQTDPKLLSIIVQNTLENAIKYTPENGNIIINASVYDKKILIEITDSGYGIPKERKSKILSDSVSSRDMSFSLYLVNNLIGKLKGGISFKSQINKGTTFSITLPA